MASTLAPWSVSTRALVDAPRAELFATDDEVLLNTDDLTAPDLPVGDDREQFVRVATLNLTDAPALGVTARVEASDAWEGTTIELPSPPEFNQANLRFLG